MSVYALYLHLKKLRVFTTVRGRYNMTSIAQLNKYMYATTVFYWNTPDSGKMKGRKELCIRIAKPSIIGGHQGLKKDLKGFFLAASSGLSNLEQPQMTSKFYIISKIR